MRRNGKRQKQALKQRQQEREEQRQFEREQRSLQEAFREDGKMSENYIEELLDNSELVVGGTDDLQEVTVAKIQSLLSRDVVLGNHTEAQEHDIRWKLEVMRIKITGMHPPEDSCVTGATRAFLFDDEMEELQPLTQQERMLVDDLIEALKARITRSREGFERQQMNTSIAESHTKTDDTADTGGGLFRGLTE